MKMPKELKDKWVKALRSGDYKQGKGTLYDPSTKSFCCLGVLEHICLEGNVEVSTKEGRENMFRGLPSQQFYDNFGMDLHSNEGSLVIMNDGNSECRGKNFKTIADFIVKHVKGY